MAIDVTYAGMLLVAGATTCQAVKSHFNPILDP